MSCVAFALLGVALGGCAEGTAEPFAPGTDGTGGLNAQGSGGLAGDGDGVGTGTGSTGGDGDTAQVGDSGVLGGDGDVSGDGDAAGDGDGDATGDGDGDMTGDGDGDGDGDGGGCVAGQSCFPDGSACASDADCVGVCGGDLLCTTAVQCGADTDGDGVTDCLERDDGDPWTDPAIFNGVHGRQRNQCSASGNCGENDTLGDVLSCMSGNPAEERDQSAGWNWANDPPNSNCDADYGFQPPWTNCDSTWAGDWRATIHMQAGHHCFELTGGTNESCTALYVSVGTPAESFGGWESLPGGTAADTQTDAGPVCFTVAEGNYPIMWHYTMDNGASSSMQLRHCFDAAADCAPSAILPAAMLRVP